MITVLIPSHNHEKFILKCLSSAIKINNLHEIIIIDDASKDKTVAIIEEFIKNNEQVSIQFHAKKYNLGLIDSLNLGLKLTKSEYVYIVASDDIPVPEGIEQCFNILEEKENLKFIIGGGINFFDHNEERSPVYRKDHAVFFNLPEMEFKKQFFTNYPSPILLQSSLFRTNVLLEVNGWDTDIRLDDYPMFVKLLQIHSRNNEDFLFAPEIITVFYCHHQNNSYSDIERQFFLTVQALKKLCPAQWIDEAIARVMVNLSLSAIKRGNFLDLIKINRKGNMRIRILFVVKMMDRIVFLFKRKYCK